MISQKIIIVLLILKKFKDFWLTFDWRDFWFEYLECVQAESQGINKQQIILLLCTDRIAICALRWGYM